jgi:putative SOS response-associated peptidase YedK
MRWGLIPSWAKDESVGNALINARSETIESRTAFREAFKHRRCLIPADSFYEWKEMHGERQPFRVMLKSGEPFCFAGLWDRWVKPPVAGKFDTDLDEAPASETIDSFTIITRAANAAIASLHDRMPVIMAPNHFGWWLKEGDERSESHKMALGHPLEAPLKIYPVSDLVNSPKTDDARCIEPVAIDRDFFERQWWGDEGKS